MHGSQSKFCIRHSVFSIALLTCALAVPHSSPAHTLVVTDVVVLLKTNGTYIVDMTVDVDALALGVSSATPSDKLIESLQSMDDTEFEASVSRAQRTLQRRSRIRFATKKEIPDVSFPDAADERARPTILAGEPTVLGLTARLSGRVPLDAVEFTFGASRAFGPVNLTVMEQETASGFRASLGPGEDSAPYRLGSLKPPRQSRLGTAVRFLILGFGHILPGGLDHILFVLGLFLFSTRWRPLLLQVTAFTIAHSVTLALSIYDIASIPSTIVEPLIALSIAFIAIENILTTDLKPWRPAVVFAFGLIHGLGFADALRELGLPEGEFLTALLTFNLGVECGQLAVIALALLAVGWLRTRIDYRRFVVRPASGAIALIGVFWTIDRLFF